jgi:hypothetical protein
MSCDVEFARKVAHVPFKTPKETPAYRRAREINDYINHGTNPNEGHFASGTFVATHFHAWELCPRCLTYDLHFIKKTIFKVVIRECRNQSCKHWWIQK